jgi:hypothetical protein
MNIYGATAKQAAERMDKLASDGNTASYYELPSGCTELQDLISYRNMNAQIGEIFRACFRYGRACHSDQLRDAKKMRFYANAEVQRLEREEADAAQRFYAAQGAQGGPDDGK